MWSIINGHAIYSTGIIRRRSALLGFLQIHDFCSRSIAEPSLVHSSFVHAYASGAVCAFQYIAKSDVLASADVQLVLELVKLGGLLWWLLARAGWHLWGAVAVVVTLDAFLFEETYATYQPTSWTYLR